MKKMIVLALSLIMLAACTQNSLSDISISSDVLFKGPDSSYTKGELYQSLKRSSDDAILNSIITNIAVKEGIDTAAIDTDAQEYLDGYVESGYSSTIISYYGSLEAFKQSYASNLLLSKLAEIYVSEHFDQMIQDDTPVKMQMAAFNELEEAEKCIDDFNNGSTFDMAALNNNSTYSPESAVYSDADSSLVFDVKEYLNSSDATGISPVIVYSSTTTATDGTQQEVKTYYVLNVESRNIDDFREDYIKMAANQVEADTIYNYLFTKHKIEFFDQDLYEKLAAKYEVLK